MLKPGMFINDRYEIIDKIGTGGMADVYKARCHRLNRFVAIKVLKQEYSDDMKFVDKFRGEAQSAAGLSHPNIVSVYDVGEGEGLYFIVMELVEGITLKSFVERKGRLEIREAVGITIQIAQGMEAAHNNHIIHRDIKPQNIIISREGKVKVTDFGIAKAATSNTITSNAMGSVHYISPEQARGGYSDEKSDIYSLGITLYEMLSGQVPYTGDNTVSVALSHIQEEAVPLRGLDPNIPLSLERIVQKCMQKKPERRYLTASALIDDLRQSITNPNGDFVKISPAPMVDSPTISISDQDVNHIKNASKNQTGDTFSTPYSVPYSNSYENPYEKTLEKPKEEELLDEDEDDSDIDPKIEKIMVGVSKVVAIILGAVLIYIILRAVGLFGAGKQNKAVVPSPSPSVSATVEPEEESPSPSAEAATIPRVIGMTLEEAQAELDRLGLKVTFTKEESDLYDIGLVTEQTPGQGEPFEEGDEVTLKVSGGPTNIAVPDVYGKPKNEADTAISDKGLKYSHEYSYSDSVGVDSVISTSPGRGSAVKPGSTITILLSKGPETKYVYVPDLSNLTEDAARDKLENAGLQAGKIKWVNSDRVEKGLVISQSQTVNTKVQEGTQIGYTISLGPKEVPKTYKYYGSVTINYNPFEYEDDQGVVKLVLTQDGRTRTIYEQTANKSTFPLVLNKVEGRNESQGVITMFLDEVLQPESYPITFNKVEQ